ncbi:lipase family protein [Mobilicoccus caccae]|uniref:Lipase n=1 Tax=Mobilicoccus caccae TaxID=1859295 RepID=A0ABQ6ILH2_9MICO|nr:lipase family protein [Mobilicoccus caccae]GMA38784.1 lipase [Mobilicoccus caccae]
MSASRLLRGSGTFLACALLVSAAAVPASASPGDIPGTAGAATLTGVAEGPRPAFYEPPSALPAKPGTVIRQEHGDTVADPLRANDLSFDARRVMYSSKDREGNTIALTGLVVVPRAKWITPGKKRPIIVHAPGTQGTGDRCAASRKFQQFSQYEILFMKNLLLRGYAIAIPDYQGLGTPGSHTYMVREAQAHAVLDMARAAAGLGFTGIDSSNPVGLNGYSQGGGAVAAAAELAPSYAPELDIKGAAAGAVPADLVPVGRKIEGSLYSAFTLYSAIGLMTGYHIDPKDSLNEAGLETLRRAEDHCALEITTFGGLKTATLTKDGKPLYTSFDTEPMRSAIADSRIGRLKPAVPVLVTHALGDDVVPYAVGKQLAKDWCAQGADVQLRTHLNVSHLTGGFTHATAAQLWFEGRFAGTKQLSNRRLL